LVDRVFTRVGAADDLGRGDSTFMVEMRETAQIVAQAGPRSLVLLDEIGRGTSTFDGLALAWAIAHQLAERNRCLALFATHYFELTALPAETEGCANIHFDALLHGSGKDDGIVFLHAVADGPANESYGLQVAKLAGVPAEVVRRARSYLARIEKFNTGGGPQGDLFAGGTAAAEGIAETPAPSGSDDAAAKLDALDPDALSPREALAALYELKALRKGAG
jgi:DNA mismatch repair protein MutS